MMRKLSSSIWMILNRLGVLVLPRRMPDGAICDLLAPAPPVMLTQVSIHAFLVTKTPKAWMPTCVGMTGLGHGQ